MLSQLKNLLVSTKNELNSILSLNRTKKIKYEEQKYFELVSFLSLWNIASKEGSNIMNLLDDVPSSDALMQQLQKLNLKKVEEQFDAVFDNQFRKVFGKRKPKVIAFIDLHEQETYSKHKRISDNIRGGKHKNGTNFFFKFASIQILSGDKILTMKVKLFRRKDTIKDIVERLVTHVQHYVKKIKVLLLDRGFRNVDMINELEFFQVPILMPCIKDKKAKKLFAKINANKKSIRFSLRNPKGKHADVTLLFIRLMDGKEIGFYTTLKFTMFHTAKYYLSLYAKRWNIETGYRVQQDFLPKTTSIKGVVRLFYFCYATAMHNLWLGLRHRLKNVFNLTVNTIKFVIFYFWITTHLSYDL